MLRWAKQKSVFTMSLCAMYAKLCHHWVNDGSQPGQPSNGICFSNERVDSQGGPPFFHTLSAFWLHTGVVSVSSIGALVLGTQGPALMAMAQVDQQSQQQAQHNPRQLVTNKMSRRNNGKDRKLQPNGSAHEFETVQNVTQNGTGYGRPIRQSSGNSQHNAAYNGSGAPMSRTHEPATISGLPQHDLEQLQINRRAEIARLQAVSCSFFSYHLACVPPLHVNNGQVVEFLNPTTHSCQIGFCCVFEQCGVFSLHSLLANPLVSLANAGGGPCRANHAGAVRGTETEGATQR